MKEYKKLKTCITLVVCILLICFTYKERTTFISYTVSLFTTNHNEEVYANSIYAKKIDYSFVQNTESSTPYSKQDILNIVYTTINLGYDQYTFYCPSEYTNCIDDIREISNDANTLTHINNFVHPYNSFLNLSMSMKESGEITLYINYLYETRTINNINEEVISIQNKILNDNMSTTTKIKTVHDYIINNSKYDTASTLEDYRVYSSSTAYGPLFEGLATCNGYTDLMAIFLTNIGVENIKIATTANDISYSNTGHVWNAVYIDNEWLHIDLTWDDPVSSDGKNYLFHTYFLVTADELYNNDHTSTTNYEEHNFNKTIYYEFK